MYDSTISAPAAIDTVVIDLRRASSDIIGMMDQLKIARGNLLSVSRGEMFDAFEGAERLWNRTGHAEAQVTAAVAGRSEEFRANMVNIDKRGAADLQA